MPLFEYRCEACDHVFEVLVREGTKIICPTCGSAKAEKLLSAFSAQVKSSGPACRDGACPSGGGGSPCCGGGGCPFS